MIDSKVIPENILKLMDAKDRPRGSAGRTVAETMERGEAVAEKELQYHLCCLLWQRGIVAFRQRMDKRSNLPLGTPDILFSLHGTAHAWEVKMPKGRLSPEQDKMAIALQNDVNRWRYAVIRSVQQAKDILDAEAAK